MNHSLLAEIFYLLITATCVVWLFRRVHMPAILAYLFAGVLSGPEVLGLVSNPDDMIFIAELGVVFLLFSLGLEFSLPKLFAMRFLVFGVGSAQVVLCLVVFMLVAMSFDTNSIGALAIGGTLALSSTAIVIKQLQESGYLGSKRGQLAVSVLLFQDIAVVPLLIVIPILADASGNQSMAWQLSFALLKGGFIVALLLAIGKWVLPRLFDEIAQARTDELFVLTTLAVAVLAGVLTYSFGLSMALGAFLAGMMLGESHYRHQLEADIRPFRDILMGLFFVNIGMALKLNVLLDYWHIIFMGMVGMMLFKALVIYLLSRLAGQKKTDAWSAGIMLSQMGEFGFVLTALALHQGVLDETSSSVLIGIGVFSMALTPLLIDKAEVLSHFILGRTERNTHVEAHALTETNLSDHVVIGGFGRVGQTVARFLVAEKVDYVAVDLDPMRVQEAAAAGESIVYGDMRKKEILNATHIERAKLVILAFNDAHRAIEVVEMIKQISPKLRIVVRTRDDDHLEELQKAGVQEVVPEILEGSLMLVSHVLHLTGVPMPRILRRVAQERKNRYGDLHGFYPGKNVDMTGEKRHHLEFLHAVTLPDDAHAVGCTLQQLDLEGKRVELHGVRRNGNELQGVDQQLLIVAQDTLILKGKPRRVERAERFLLEGD